MMTGFPNQPRHRRTGLSPLARLATRKYAGEERRRQNTQKTRRTRERLLSGEQEPFHVRENADHSHASDHMGGSYEHCHPCQRTNFRDRYRDRQDPAPTVSARISA
jgi:hypothetical protein